jgi:hypothetical protein
MIVHLLEKLTFDWVSRDRTDDRINSTFGTKCRVVIVSPMFDLTRRKDLQTIKAPADVALFERKRQAKPMVDGFRR